MRKNIVATLSLLTLLAGCGGGGGSTSSTAPGTAPVDGTSNPTAGTNVGTTVTDPLTGTAAPGVPTMQLSGVAYADSTITAYNVLPDGSNGAALGPAVKGSPFVDKQFDQGGAFTMTLTTVPTGMVRLVATGGHYQPYDVDNSTQAVTAMELVAPYVTTGFNYFKITTISHLASHVLTFKAKHGATLADAFKQGMKAALKLDSGNVLVLNDVSVYKSVLQGKVESTTPYLNTSDPLNKVNRLFNTIEYFGVQYDLPTSAAVRVVAAAAENDYPLATVDGEGKPINVGKWVNNVFDESVPRTLDDLMAAGTPNGIPVKDPKTGLMVHPGVANFISQNFIEDFYLDGACRFGKTDALITHYPWYFADNVTGPTSPSFVQDCVAAAARRDYRVAWTNTSPRMNPAVSR